MSTAQAAEATFRDFFGALGVGDLDGARLHLHPDAIWTVKARGVPGSGEHRGPQAIITFISSVRALFAPGSPQIEVTSTICDGSLVIMESHGTGKLLDGRDYDNFYVMAVEVKDGLIFALREYMDSYYVHNLFKEE